MTFHPEILERLLFPINEKAYESTQKTLNCLGDNHTYFNIFINYNDTDLNIEELEDSTDFDINLSYIKNPSIPYENLFNLSFYQENILNSFYIPIKYLLGHKNKEIMTSYSNFIYSYTLNIDKNSNVYPINKKVRINDEYDSYLYIGRTRQSWLNRNAFHCQDIKQKPHRLIYQALNGNYGKIVEKKLFIEHAGLTEDEVILLEPNEIKNRSLNEKFPNGLNMITGENLYPVYKNKKAS